MIIKCPRCGQEKEAHHRDTHICVDCANAENARLTYYRQHQENWLEEAKEQGIKPWLQQPGETQWEYTIWCAYRDSYPGKKPTYSDIAKQLNTTYNVVKKVAQRWNFPVRMQLWIAECDRITMLQRKEEILNMNKEHIEMAAKLRQKLKDAIEAINPESLKPSEIASLAKLAAEMERKARLDAEAQEEIKNSIIKQDFVGQQSPELKQPKQNNLQQVLQILLQTGAVKNVSAIGVKETTTREIVAKDNEGNISKIIQEDNS